jgi:hypothetical protein
VVRLLGVRPLLSQYQIAVQDEYSKQWGGGAADGRAIPSSRPRLLDTPPLAQPKP